VNKPPCRRADKLTGTMDPVSFVAKDAVHAYYELAF